MNGKTFSQWCVLATFRLVVFGIKGNPRSGISSAFRAAVIGQTLAVFLQPLLAGLALSGDLGALNAHMVLGGLALVISVVQVVLALSPGHDVPRPAIAASVGLFLGEGVQMASGRLGLFVLHLPVGATLFAGLTLMSLWALNVVPICDCRQSVTTRASPARSMIGGDC